MRLSHTGKPDNYYYFVIEDCRTETGRRTSRTIEKLGCASAIREKYKVDDAEAWCRNYVNSLNARALKEKSENQREIVIKLREDHLKDKKSNIFNAGYLILEKLYYEFGMNRICEELQDKHPHITGYDLTEVLKVMLFGRILFPSSKLALVNDFQHRFFEKYEIELQHIYRAMDVLNEDVSLVQDRLYQYTANVCERDVNHLYYDCTNFYSEKELEDCDRDDMSDDWKKNHTLRKYGKSKENRPNPIVQMGLFMDGNGIPLGFCINPGNINEQTTIVPLEKELIKNFKTTDITVCTDAGLSGDANRSFNNVGEDDLLVKMGFRGQRHFICTQSIKKLKLHLKEWSVEKTGWSYFSLDTAGKRVTKTNFDLSKLSDPACYAEHYHTIFFKERTTAEGMDARLIVTFSIKYYEFLRSLRERKIKRAAKMIENRTFDRESDHSPKSLIEKTYSTEDGEIAVNASASLNTQKIEEDARFDGFYAVTTNIFADKMPAEQIAAISARRWEIEECFRIMKTDLESRPFYHSKDQRITAHFLVCFMALVLLRGVEQKIASLNENKLKYPDGKYSIEQIIQALKDIRVIEVDNGNGYQPDYNNSELISDLLECCGLTELTHEVVMKDTMKKFLKKISAGPKKLKQPKTT